MRWAQLTLAEDDPGTYDLAFWLDYFRRTHSDAACLSAGGCVAYYPTKIPLHYRSQWLGAGDAFGDLVAGCRKLNMVVIARTDPHAAHQDVCDQHPDWIAVNAAGEKIRHPVMPELWITCALGPYNFDFMTAVTKEIVALYKVDGVFSNRWSGSGMCYCEHCRENFHAASGMDLPRTANPHDPSRRAYMGWRQQRLFELWRLWDGEIRKINPAARYIPNSGGGATADLDMKTIGELAPILFADRQARSGVTPPWANGKNGKEYRSTMGAKPIGGIFSVGVEEPYRWKDSVQNAPEIRLWVLDGIANGLRPWFTKFAGSLNDRRWLKVVEDLYVWHYRNERYLRNQRPLARVAMVYSQQTSHFYGAQQARQKVEDHTLGYYQALIEARIPFEMVHDQLLDAAHIDPFKVLDLPQHRRAFHRTVRANPRLRAARRQHRRHPRNLPLRRVGRAPRGFRPGRPLRRVFRRHTRCPYAELVPAPGNRPATGKRHPLLAGLDDTSRIINGVSRVHTKTIGAYPNPPLTLVPSYPDLPMEEVFPRIPKTDIPEVFVREVGKGRVVYFPWDIDRTFWEVLSVDHAKLLRNAVNWAANEPSPVTVTGPGVLDVAIWRQASSITVHLVNLTNPMMMKGPLREFLPTPPQNVSVRLPDGAKAKKVQLLVSGQTPRVQVSNGTVSLTIPSILDHEVIAIDL